MTDTRQFGAAPLDCAAVELWLAESAEKTLPAATAEQVRGHAAGCAACEEKLAQARSGREWLLVLKQESLEPPANLVAKILSRTSLANTNTDLDRSLLDFHGQNRADKDSVFKESASGHAILPNTEDDYVPVEGTSDQSTPAWQHNSVVVLRRTLLDPRLALVAAMAFFSISLTLNMLGFRLTHLHAADLAPDNMHRAVVRQYAEANASVVRYYENLRIVYEVEARVQQLRRAAETSTPPQRGVRPRKQSFDSTGDSSGNSSTRSRPNPKPVPAGPRMDVVLHLPIRQSTRFSGCVQIAVGHTLATFFVPPFVFHPAPLASSCSLRKICSSMRYFSARERRLA